MKTKLFSVTASDCNWSYYRGSGKGGQKKNKTSNCVQVTHIKSGASAYSEEGRSQRHNKETAFRKMAESDKFQKWLKVEIARRSGELALIEEQVEKELLKVSVEIKDEKGLWKKVPNNQQLGE
jgi:protein subunit release factor B